MLKLWSIRLIVMEFRGRHS